MALAAALIGPGYGAPSSFDNQSACRNWVRAHSEYIACDPILRGDPMKGEFERNPDGSLRWAPVLAPRTAPALSRPLAR